MESAFFQDQTDYFNDEIVNYGSGFLSNEHTIHILDIKKKFDKLDKLHINGDNFTKKAIEYHGHRKNLKEEFDYDIPKTLPFDSPAELKIELDNYLSGIGLEPKQISILTNKIIGAKRRPTHKTINNEIITSVNGVFKITDKLTQSKIKAFKEEQKKLI